MARPNILFVMTDDQGPWAYGVAGDPDARTPNLDRLCRDGARLLKGETPEWEDDLFTQYSMWNWHQNGAKLRSFRTPEWKLIRDFRHEEKDELYDLKEDRDEHLNLIDSPDPAVQHIREQLNESLLGRMRSINDPEC